MIFPCQQEGCLRRRDSHSQCLDELTVAQVLSAVDAALRRVSRPMRALWWRAEPKRRY